MTLKFRQFLHLYTTANKKYTVKFVSKYFKFNDKKLYKQLPFSSLTISKKLCGQNIFVFAAKGSCICMDEKNI